MGPPRAVASSAMARAKPGGGGSVGVDDGDERAPAAPVGRPRANPRPIEGSARDEVIAVATRLFSEQGFAQTTMAQIAEAAGLRQSSLYYYFRRKELILEATFSVNRAPLDFLEAHPQRSGQRRAAPLPARPLRRRPALRGPVRRQRGVAHLARPPRALRRGSGTIAATCTAGSSGWSSGRWPRRASSKSMPGSRR